MLEIDGSHGEGGGQILRTAVALAAVTGKPLEITNIRANRPKPGLAAQHITAIRSVAELCNASTTTLELGASAVEFVPGRIRAGAFKFETGTAGSITLVLQACLIPALFANEKVTISITGGTDVKWSPPVDYFRLVFLKLLAKMDVVVELKLLRRGYYPKGGGEISVEIAPVTDLKRLEITEPGELQKIVGIAHLSKLPEHILKRLTKTISQKLSRYENLELRDEIVLDSYSPGTGITLCAETAHSVLGASALGERGIAAEKVGNLAAEALVQELEGGGSVDAYAADQLLPYMALNGGEITVRELSGHARTNIWLIEKILDKKFEVLQTEGGLWKVKM